MKRTFMYDNDNVLHLVESNEPTTICGLDVTELEDDTTAYNQTAFEEVVAEYFGDNFCPKCFPDVAVSTATFEVKAQIISEKEASSFVEPARGVKI